MKKTDKPEDMTMSGRINKTGIGTAKARTDDMLRGVNESSPTSQGDEASIAEVRAAYMADAEPIGTVPPPTTGKGVLKTAGALLTGEKPTVLIDKIGERLAFERTGTRLYDTLVSKLDGFGTFAGGPTREELVRIGQEEAQHFALLQEAMKSLGADPTAMTPSADLAAVESMGVVQVISDARTRLPECLHAILVAELVDNAGWDILTTLAAETGHDALVERFEKAMKEEEQHLVLVRGWLAEHTRRSAAVLARTQPTSEARP